nr:uncharacterized protein LOC109152581 [Ipomoea batatas]
MEHIDLVGYNRSQQSFQPQGAYNPNASRNHPDFSWSNPMGVTNLQNFGNRGPPLGFQGQQNYRGFPPQQFRHNQGFQGDDCETRLSSNRAAAAGDEDEQQRRPPSEREASTMNSGGDDEGLERQRRMRSNSDVDQPSSVSGPVATSSSYGQRRRRGIGATSPAAFVFPATASMLDEAIEYLKAATTPSAGVLFFSF